MADDFDMPDASHTFEERGGWVLKTLMADYNLTPNQSGGIVGNVGFESMGFKHLQEISPLVPGSAGGYGWAQWTGPRRRSFMQFCSDEHLDPASDEANLGYLEDEFDNGYAYVLANLRKLTTLEDCVFAFGRLDEAPAGTTATHLPGFDGRLAYAKRALAGYRAMPAPAPVPAGTVQATVSGSLWSRARLLFG